MNRFGHFLVLLALCVVATTVSAQKHVNQASGIDPRGQFAVGEIDAINLFNGSLTVSLPLGPRYPVGPEFGYQLSLVYSSGTWQNRRVCDEGEGSYGSIWTVSPYLYWTRSGTVTSYVPPPNAGTGEEWTPHENDPCHSKSFPSPGNTAGLGWSLHFGLLLPPRQNPQDGWERAAEAIASIVHLAPDGSETTLFAEPSGEFRSYNGTFQRLRQNSSECQNPGCWLLERADGLDEEYTNLGTATQPDWRMVLRRDRFGSWLKVEYVESSTVPGTFDHWIVSDSRDRVHHLYLSSNDAEMGPVVDTVDLAAPTGRRLIYQLTKVPCSVPRGAPHQNQATASLVAPMLASVRALDGTTVLSEWQMPTSCVPGGQQSSAAYDLTGQASSATTTGALQQVIFPTGARIEWRYRAEDGVSLPPEAGFRAGYIYPAGSTGRRIGRFSLGVRIKRVIDRGGAEIARWTYDPALEDIVETRPDNCFPINTNGEISTASECHEKRFKTRVKAPDHTVTEHFFSVFPVPQAVEEVDPQGWDLVDYGKPFWRTVSDTEPAPPADAVFLSERTRNASGQVVRERWVRYESDEGFVSDGEGREVHANHRLAAERTVFPMDGGRYREVVRSGWDGHGHFTNIVERGSANWLGSGGQVSERTTELTYDHDEASWMLEKRTSRRVVGDATEVMTWAELGGADSGAWVISQQRQYQAKTGNPSNHDRLLVYGYDSQGQLTSEKHYGGDRQSLAGGVPGTAGFRAEHSYQHGVRKSTRILDDCHNGSEVLKTLDLTIDANTGQTTASKDAAGEVTGYEYDLLGRPTKLKPAGVSATEYEYNLTDLWIKTQTGTCSGSSCPYVRQSFLYLDGLGRVLQESNWWPNRGSGTPKYAQRQWQYDGLGRTTKESTWRYNQNDFNGVDSFPSGWTEFRDFDAFGRATRVRPPEGSVHDATVSYSGQGEREAVRTSKVATGATGAETAVSRTEVYDAFGRLIEVKEPSGANGTVVSTKYRYDVGNRLTRVETTSGGVTQVRAFDFDGLGQLRLETHPELGVSGNGSKAYDFYDVLGNPGSSWIVGTSGDGLRGQLFQYDPAGRLIEVFDARFPDQPLKQYFYSRVNASDTNKSQGKLVRTRRHHPELGLWIAESFEYTGFGGRMSKKVTSLTGQPSGPDAFSQSYTYNSLGELASISYPQCSSTDSACVGATTTRLVDYGFNRGLLDSVTGFVPEIDYSANGRISRLKHGNQVEEIQENDEDGQLRPKQILVKKGTSVHWDTSTYLYDGTGNIKAIGTETFQYDKVSRLISGRVLQSPGVFRTEALAFDAFGNMTSRTVTGAGNSAPSVDSATNRLDEEGVSYDASGNLLRLNATSTQYTFDVLDEMRQRQDGPTVWQYLYTADGERVIERNPATGLMRWTLRGPGNQPLRILEDRGPGQWTLLRDYIYAGGRLVASIGTEGPRHYHLDHLGSVRLETDAAGAVVKQRNFLPFGEELTTGASENELRFTGHERDDVVANTSADDLDYMHARFCSPTTGRFLSVDPVLGRVGVPQGWNRYGYVLNDPLNLVDPTGEFSADLAQSMAQMVQRVPPWYFPPPDMWAWARNAYTDRFEAMAVEGNYLAAFIDFLGVALVIPPPPDPDPFAQKMGIPPVAVGRLGRNPLALQKQLASEAQVAELAAGGARAIAGAGAAKKLRDVDRLVAQYGGKRGEWSKVSSSAFTAADGVRFEIHAYKNTVTGELVELKTKFK